MYVCMQRNVYVFVQLYMAERKRRHLEVMKTQMLTLSAVYDSLTAGKTLCMYVCVHVFLCIRVLLYS
jgi:hypothetical protein